MLSGVHSIEKLTNRAIQEIQQMQVYKEDYLSIQESVTDLSQIIQSNSVTFSLAAKVLPRRKRQAIYSFYAFCRTADDLADLHDLSGKETLSCWLETISNHCPSAKPHPILEEWLRTSAEYRIPLTFSSDLLQTLLQDFEQTRYESFDDLIHYCYGVASTVGLISMHIFGFSSLKAVQYAIELGIALQITNILRDVREDFERGRIYLPQDELAHFQIDEAAINRQKVSSNWRSFMQFQIARNRQLYKSALPGIAYLHMSARLPVALSAVWYRDILRDIERHSYDVFSRRSHASWRRKLITATVEALPLVVRYAAKMDKNIHEGRLNV
ncbi:squalene/phytoene synthase family protein [Alicyclobacillus sp. TC]|uniref:Phytoene synthase n=1 Tax=Alicyclobacillus tolerans TaxID=90970 RepID=A0ABT9LYY4_9BACL|nr:MULTISPECIES: phytoene/squalene synthase family protein [Alicyclobacillus]MDP9729455.1 phytoene synthase [Alicyclobacillus tengchongensis]QRF22821.1 squalene/phytoene synthase family protein [Alicyclobacillus sp. TC]